MANIEDVRILNFSDFTSKEGHLVPLEQNREIPFSIKRIFYVFGVNSNKCRGEHSHVTTEQVLISLNGNCQVRCHDGSNEKTFQLSSPLEGLYIPAMIWGEQVYDNDTILLILASTHYEKEDYIEDWKEFVKGVESGNS